MARVKIDLPNNVIASFKIPIRITDINYGNHLGNNAVVEIIHEARMQFLQQYGYTELNIEAIGLIMADIAVEFKSEAFYKDIIEVKIATDEISKVSFDLYYELTTQRNNEEILIAKAKTGMVCFDYTNKKVVALPKKLREIIMS